MSHKKHIETLHPIDSFGIKEVSLSGIRVERLEDRIKPAVPFPHKHDFFQFILVLKGSGGHQIDFRNHKVQKEQLFLMKPGQMHSWNLHKGIQAFVIEFSYQSLNSIKDGTRLIHDLMFAPDAYLFDSKETFERVLKIVEIMFEESNHKRSMQDLSLQAHLTSLLINIIRLYQEQLQRPKALTTIEKFRSLVEKNYKTSHSVEAYARELKLSSRALTMQLLRSIKKPPRELIQERILLEAKRYLAFSDLTIAEIGYELGFEDANYFSRFFRLHEKMTPAEFRRGNSSQS